MVFFTTSRILGHVVAIAIVTSLIVVDLGDISFAPQALSFVINTIIV